MKTKIPILFTSCYHFCCHLLSDTINMMGFQDGFDYLAWKLTNEAYDAAYKGVEVTAVSCHNGFLLGQESFPRGFHHIHGHLSNENLHMHTRT